MCLLAQGARWRANVRSMASAPQASEPVDLDAVAERWARHGFLPPELADRQGRVELYSLYESHGVEAATYADVPFDDILSTINLAVLVPARTIESTEAMRRSGLDPETFARITKALGIADQSKLSDLDLEAIEIFKTGVELMFSEEELIAFTRIMSASMDRIAEAATALFRIDVASSMDERGASELEYAVKNLQSAEMLETIFIPIRSVFSHRLEAAVSRSDVARGRAMAGPQSSVALSVGFVDLVGFTSMSGEIELDELARFVLEFEASAQDIVGDRGGRVVKLIGDEVMFVNTDVDAAIETAAALIEGIGSSSKAPRGGVATGDVVARGGDYYGRIVNLAARLVDQAVSGEVLVDEATVDGCERSVFEPAGRRQLKGFTDPVRLFSIEVAGGGGDDFEPKSADR